MAFKMKGPTFFNVGKKGQYEKSAAFQHRVGDNPEHREEYGVNHSEDLQTEEEHKASKNNKKKDNPLKQVKASVGIKKSEWDAKTPKEKDDFVAKEKSKSGINYKSPMKHRLEGGGVSPKTTAGHNKMYGVGHNATTHEEHKALKSTKKEKKEE